MLCFQKFERATFKKFRGPGKTANYSSDTEDTPVHPTAGYASKQTSGISTQHRNVRHFQILNIETETSGCLYNIYVIDIYERSTVFSTGKRRSSQTYCSSQDFAMFVLKCSSKMRIVKKPIAISHSLSNRSL